MVSATENTKVADFLAKLKANNHSDVVNTTKSDDDSNNTLSGTINVAPNSLQSHIGDSTSAESKDIESNVKTDGFDSSNNKMIPLGNKMTQSIPPDNKQTDTPNPKTEKPADANPLRLSPEVSNEQLGILDKKKFEDVKSQTEAHAAANKMSVVAPTSQDEMAHPSEAMPSGTNSSILSNEKSNEEARTQLTNVDPITHDDLISEVGSINLSSAAKGNEFVGPFLHGLMNDIYPILKNTSMDSQQLVRAMADIKVAIELRLT